MNLNSIKSSLKSLGLSQRKVHTCSWYLLSLILPSRKHTMSFASERSGLHCSQFSRLLGQGPKLFTGLLNRAMRRALERLAKTAGPLVAGSNWRLAIIIDSTSHGRSSRRAQNAQFNNFGQGHFFGHQWTNIAIFIGGVLIPLPPIPFYSKRECERRGIEYKTEIQKVADFLAIFSLGGLFRPDEVVVLLDSGYDSKEIQNTVLARRWGFIISFKKSRTMSDNATGWQQVSRYFEDGRRPETTLRLDSKSLKKVWESFHVKQRVGYLKGVHRQVKLLCSRKNRGPMKFFACSCIPARPREILLVYRLRWKIEVFHRDIKSYLGLKDFGARSFDSLWAFFNFTDRVLSA